MPYPFLTDLDYDYHDDILREIQVNAELGEIRLVTEVISLKPIGEEIAIEEKTNRIDYIDLIIDKNNSLISIQWDLTINGDRIGEIYYNPDSSLFYVNTVGGDFKARITNYKITTNKQKKKEEIKMGLLETVLIALCNLMILLIVMT